MHKKLCILPWVHLHPFPDGRVSLCCYADHATVGHLSKNSIDEIANSDIMNKVRREFLTGEHSEELNYMCSECWTKEDVGVKSGREMYNYFYGEKVIEEIIKNTNPDGSLKTKFKLLNISSRVSNLCNYSCRSCAADRSSVIAQEQGVVNFVKSIKDIRPNYINELLPYLNDIRLVVFLGGESILIEEHDVMLEEIIRLNRQNQVKILYFSNLSKLQHKGRSLIEYGKIFNDFTIFASIDALDKRLELLRNGSNWDTVLTNLIKLKENNIRIYPWVTLSNMNAHHAPDLILYLIENEFLKADQFEFNALHEPIWLQSTVMPLKLKDEVEYKFLQMLEKVKTYYPEIDYQRLEKHSLDFVKYMKSKDQSDKIKLFIERNMHLDKIRNQNLFEIYPELIPFKEYYDSKF